MALQNLRSSTPSKRPDASSMSDGQIALNTAAASAGLFFKDSNGDLVKTGPVHIGTTAPNSTPATGGSTGNSKGEAWLDTSNNNYVLKIYDGTAFRSVEIAPGSARQLLQTNAAGTDVEFTSNVDVPGTLDVTSTAVFDANVGIGVSNPARPIHVSSSLNNPVRIQSSATYSRIEFEANGTTSPANVSIGAENNDFRIFTGSGTGRLIVKDDGKTGINVIAPLGQLHVRPADECNFVVREESTQLVLSAETNSGRDNNRTMALEGGLFTFSISGNEKARIDSGGRMGIGTSQAQNYDNTAHQLVVGDNAGNRGITIATGTGSRGTLMFADGTSGLSAYRGFIQYDHFTDSLIFAANSSERVRIDSSGNVLMRRTTNPDSGVLCVDQDASGGNVGISTITTSTGTRYHNLFRNGNGQVGAISTNGSATTYATSSDYRLKENVVDLDGAIGRVKQLAPKRFNFIADADLTVDGFLAHEAQTVVPEAVTGTHNEVDGDGNAVMQGIDQAKFVPLLTAALQEAITRIETLEQRLTDAGL